MVHGYSATVACFGDALDTDCRPTTSEKKVTMCNECGMAYSFYIRALFHKA